MHNTGEYYILNICDKKDLPDRYGEIICGDIEQGGIIRITEINGCRKSHNNLNR